MKQACSIADALVEAARALSHAVAALQFPFPVSHVYNPLDYAWPVHEAYLRRFCGSPKRVLFLGMNPGPFGMMQTGVPFGEIAAVRDWMGLAGSVLQPSRTHPKRPIDGFACSRSEVSGRRLWGLFKDQFGSAERFFADHFVVNYCPLGFLDEGGRNLTPDKFHQSHTTRLHEACDRHLREVVASLKPKWVIGVGDFAERRAHLTLDGQPVRIGKVLHPSPASPTANRGWSATAVKQLRELGVWA